MHIAEACPGGRMVLVYVWRRGRTEPLRFRSESVPRALPSPVLG